MPRALRPLLVGWLLVLGPTVACRSSPAVPAHPTWSDVEPILRADCLQCHGGSAASTASLGAVVYRFDFFDVTTAVCGDAAAAVELSTFAAGWAGLMATSITSVNEATRPRMPPAPSPSLADWEWQTLLNWTADPVKGSYPPDNRPPTLHLTTDTRVVDQRLNLSAVLEDPDGQSAIGVLTVGDYTLKMDRPGAFTATVDTSNWPAGDAAIAATVCDGWSRARYDLGGVSVLHP
jgi:hypothetical protein